MATQPQLVSPTQFSESETQDRLGVLVDRLSKLADDQVKRKGQSERRWLDNLRAFHGRYDEQTEEGLREGNKSRAYVKITRKKANSWEARLSALLFPTDDENWDIRPTPVPSLNETAKNAVAQAEQQVQAANQNPDPTQAAQQAQQAQATLTEAQMAKDAMQEALKRGMAMRQEMKDQLVECDYASEARMVIRDAVRLGTGILKGPLAGDKARGEWLLMQDGTYQYNRESDPAPIFKWVDPWSYFPDMSAIRPEDREFEFERHLWSAKDLKRLVRERGFNREAVKQIVEDRTPGFVLNDSSLNYLTSLRAINGSTDAIKDRYVGWEYHGPLTCQDIAIVLRAMGREDDAVAYEEKDDPLIELRVICYFCDGKVLKLAATYPLDSGESLYSLFTFEESEASLFGYGIPEIMADSQKSMNGAWRMALDNAALSVGPQIFIDRDVVEPANRDWTLTPRKIWYKRKGAGIAQGTVLETKAIENNVKEIMNIVELSRRFIDDETALPVQAEGELTDNPNITATATNFMSMASNITFRRVVKNFDDGITTTCIRRLYDWNMQHNTREEIKGDMKVDARGSSALLQRELQSQMLLNVAQNWSSHPVLGQAIKTYDAVTEALKSASIQPETIMVDREEFEQSQAASAQAAQKKAEQEDAVANDPEKNPSVIAARERTKAATIDGDTRLEVANLNRETELIKLAQHYDIKIEELKTKLDIKQLDLGHKERMLVAETAAEEHLSKNGDGKGSGGYVSQ